MNKISKKIVALVTMAAFVLTLVPAAAFGASTDFSVTESTMKITKVNDEDVTAPVSVKANDDITLSFELNNVSSGVYDQETAVVNFNTSAPDQNTLQIWAEQDGKIVDALGVVSYNYTSATSTDTAKDFTAKVELYRAGDYTICAGLGATVEEAAKDANSFKIDVEANTVNVYADPAATAKSVEFAVADPVVTPDYPDSQDYAANNQTVGIDYTDDLAEIPANGIATSTITGTAYLADDGNGDLAVGTTFDVAVVGGNGMIVDKSQVTTGRDGTFKLKVSFTKAGKYKILLTNSSMKVTLDVDRSETAEVKDIETTVDNGKVLLAGNDTANFTEANGYVENTNEVVDTYFADAVQFTITDKNGDVKTGDLDNQPAYGTDAAAQHDLYVKVTKPQGSALTASDLNLIWNGDKEAYTLDYVGKSASTDLTPGEYTVTISLLSGESATATFTLAKFGTVEGLNVKVYDNTSKDGSPVKNPVLGNVLENEIVLGKSAAVVAYKVDENGLEVPTKDNVSVAVEGSAVNNIKKGADLTDNSNTNSVVAFGTGPVTDEEKLVGTQVTINAFDTVNNKWAKAELTVVDGKTTNTLAFNNESGEANKNNTVDITVVDENGKVVNAGGTVYAYVESKADENAYVDVNVTKNTVTAGKGGQITVFADRETTADIVVAVVDSNAIYAKTLTYTFGEEDIAADTSVVMTIGSNDFVVNNDVVNVPDAAPYVAKDRTFVPFRALGEAIGADVVWDNDARTVTYTLGKTEVVMTIGETTYTVNGEEKTMDVAPEITNDRTYVPVRFVGEALGFKVTALSAADGTTSSVVFQK